MIITIANAKGGVAKTTTSLYLAAAYVRRFPDRAATILDADPQSSASLWQDMAAENEGWHEPIGVEAANLTTLRRVRRETPDGLIIVDAPPQGRLLEASLQTADFVIVPTSDSPLDLQQAWATVEAVPEGTPRAVLIVRAETATRACADVVAALDEWETPRFDAVVRKRQDLKAALGHVPGKLYEYADVLAELLEAVS